MYQWVKITSDFDRSIPFTKIKWNNNYSGYYSNSPDGYFSENPNINTDGEGWSHITSEEYGYAGQNRFNISDKYFSNRLGNFENKYWNDTSKTTDLGNGYYEYTAQRTLYWSGLADISNYSVIGDAVEVYVETIAFELSTSALTFSSEESSNTITVTSPFNSWTASTTDSWITVNPTTGDTGDTIATISVSNNLFTERIGTVTFTDDDNTVELTVTQFGNSLVPFKKLFINDKRLN